MNYLKYTISFFFFYNVILFGQNLYIIDSITSEIISYANVKHINKNRGVFSDENGIFNKEYFNTQDTIKVSHLNYVSKTLSIRSINNNTIFLKPKSERLNEIIISKKVGKNKTIGYLKNNKNLSWFIQPNNELATLIKYEKDYKTAYINKIFIPIGKKTIIRDNGKLKKSYPKFNSVFKVHIYSNKGNLPSKEVIDKPIIIKCNQNSNDIIEINISEQNIELPKEGLFFAVEMIGEVNIKGKIIENKTLLPSFKFTKKSKKDIQSISYTKFAFSNNEWISIKNDKKYKHISKYNMAVGLSLEIYKN
ncbi:carboxypeptidase-like regulatory domain-containing protein [Tenacibaculum sediminilitoris]|uniref:carboxypeptidase-like regulatory domain-containing protein n=1 Tax=Tenacibaculum sediminilitoris TaxID=1820334 RepID=UPI0038B4BCBF